MKYTAEFAKFVTMEIEADSEQEAENKMAVMEDEEIETRSKCERGWEIWQIGPTR